MNEWMDRREEVSRVTSVRMSISSRWVRPWQIFSNLQYNNKLDSLNITVKRLLNRVTLTAQRRPPGP